MRFSVIIPVRSINDYLKENISHLKKLSHTDFEVIIILDKLEEFDFKGDTRFILIESGPVGPGEKRNLGAERASGEILAFLDDDAYPAKDWLKQAESVIKERRLYALGGPALTPLDAGFRERIGGLVLASIFVSGGTYYRHTKSMERYINDYPTVNLFVTRDAFNKVGGFYTEFWPGEDTKLCLDLVTQYRENFFYSPKPIVYHHRRELFTPHLKQISRYGRHRGQFARIFPGTSRKPMYFIPSVFLIGLLMGPFVSRFSPFLDVLYELFVNVYILLLVVEGIRKTRKENTVNAFTYFTVGVFLTHIVYGYNFLIGFIKKPRLKLKSIDTKTGNYNEG